MQWHDKMEELLSGTMKSGILKMPFGDFEENLMIRIERENRDSKMLLHDRKLSFSFFIMGTLLGLGINFMLERTKYVVPGISSGTFLRLFQCVFILLFLIQLEDFIQSFKFYIRRIHR